MDNLTAESKYLLAAFMKEYYTNLKNGQSRLQAKEVAVTLDDVQPLLRQAKREDLKDYIYELKDSGFLDSGDGSNEPVYMTLTNQALVWSQNKVGNNIKKWEHIALELFNAIKSL